MTPFTRWEKSVNVACGIDDRPVDLIAVDDGSNISKDYWIEFAVLPFFANTPAVREMNAAVRDSTERGLEMSMCRSYAEGAYFR